MGRVVTPLWGEGWLPVKIINPTTSPILLRRNAKVADVYPCIALEDFNSETNKKVQQNVSGVGSSHSGLTARTYCRDGMAGGNDKLAGLGLQDLAVNNCDVSEIWKEKLTDLIVKYEDVFLRHHLDCGKAAGFCHRIQLTDDRPFLIEGFLQLTTKS